MSLPGFAAQGIVLSEDDDAYLQSLTRVLHRPLCSGWICASHFGVCGQSCPCCRVLEHFGFCDRCAFVFDLHWVVLQIRRFAPPAVTVPKLELYQLLMVGAHFGWSPSVLRTVAGFLGASVCSTTTFALGFFRAVYFERLASSMIVAAPFLLRHCINALRCQYVSL